MKGMDLKGYRWLPRVQWRLVVGLMLVLLGGWMSPVAAAPACRMVNQESVCLLDIRRSAKYHWEYRATVQVGDRAPVREIYDCRDRRQRRSDGPWMPIQAGGTGDYVCRLLQSGTARRP
jgi:hypothetical protein